MVSDKAAELRPTSAQCAMPRLAASVFSSVIFRLADGWTINALMHSPLLQVLEHEKHKAKQKPSIMQRIQALQAANEEDTSTSASHAPGRKSKPQVAVITATGKLSCEWKPFGHGMVQAPQLGRLSL